MFKKVVSDRKSELNKKTINWTINPTEIKVSHLGSGDHHFKSGFVGTEFTGVQHQWNEIIWVSRISLYFYSAPILNSQFFKKMSKFLNVPITIFQFHDFYILPNFELGKVLFRFGGLYSKSISHNIQKMLLLIIPRMNVVLFDLSLSMFKYV